MRSICVVMKSGYSFSFPCEKFKTNSIEGVLIGYSYEGATGRRPIFIRLEDVDVIIYEGDVEEDRNDHSQM